MKTLFIVRHAKSSWDHPALRDIERPLNSRGINDAPKMAKAFKREFKHIDHLISSPAVRAFSTCQVFAQELNYPEEKITKEEGIYGASAASMLQQINQFKNEWNSVCIFGHNPTFTNLAEQLCSIYIGNLPTCGIVGIEFGVDSWEAVSFGSGTQVYFDYPKKHQ